MLWRFSDSNPGQLISAAISPAVYCLYLRLYNGFRWLELNVKIKKKNSSILDGPKLILKKRLTGTGKNEQPCIIDL